MSNCLSKKSEENKKRQEPGPMDRTLGGKYEFIGLTKKKLVGKKNQGLWGRKKEINGEKHRGRRRKKSTNKK